MVLLNNEGISLSLCNGLVQLIHKQCHYPAVKDAFIERCQSRTVMNRNPDTAAEIMPSCKYSML